MFYTAVIYVLLMHSFQLISFCINFVDSLGGTLKMFMQHIGFGPRQYCGTPSFKRHFFMHKVFICIGPDKDCLQDNGLVWTAVFTLKLSCLTLLRIFFFFLQKKDQINQRRGGHAITFIFCSAVQYSLYSTFFFFIHVSVLNMCRFTRPFRQYFLHLLDCKIGCILYKVSKVRHVLG